MELKGKNINFLGDSITEGFGTSIAFPNHHINVKYFLLLRFRPFSIST